MKIETKMEPNVKIPWSAVGNLNDFLYFCCPECPAKDRSMKKFVTHALKQHPNAKNFLKSIGKKHNIICNNKNFKKKCLASTGSTFYSN